MSRVLNHFYEFENFRLNPARRLLARDGKLVPLKPKVFDTLLMLVENSGKIVDKEDLLKEVWGGATVEEVGLAKNISTLRKALGESPDEHRYIVTVPGRGYRFVASVTTIPVEVEEIETAEIEAAVIETHTVSRVTSEEEVIEVEPSDTKALPSQKPTSRSLRVAIALGVLLPVAAGLAFYFHRRPALTAQDTILLADFLNRTGDPVFDETLQQGLAVQLDQSPLLNIFPEARVRQTLRRMGRSPDDSVTEEIAREICQRQGLKAFIAGSIAPLGSYYAITLEAFDGQNGATLARTQLEAQNKEQVLQTLSKGASELRRSLGESLGSIQKFDALLERTTISLEALRAYSLGTQERRRGKMQQAVAFFRRAVELDPNFAYANSALAAAYRNQRQPALAAQYAAKAYDLRDRVGENEKLYVTSLYHEMVTGDIGRNIEALQLYARTYPRNSGARNNLAVAYATVGEFDQGLGESQVAMRLDPNSAIRYGVVGNILVRLSRFADARKLYQRALEQQMDSLSIRRGLFRIAFVEQNQAEMEQQLTWAAANSNEHAALDWQARGAAYFGQWRRSAEYAQRAVGVAARNEEREIGAGYAAESALRGAVLGQCATAGTMASQALSLERDPVSLTRANLALALCGETSKAQAGIEELKKRYPEHTIVNWIWLPVIHAALALHRGQSESVVEFLKPAQRYEAAAEFWPQYLRGQAYLQLGKGAEAATEFTKILDHRGQDVQSVLYLLARLGMARASVLKQDLPRARDLCQEFLTGWRDADPDLSTLNEARKDLSTCR